MGGQHHHVERVSTSGSIHKLGIDLSLITSLTGLDDLDGFVCSEESVHAAGSWLLQILVVLPVIGGFFFPVITQVLKALDVIHALVIGQHRDDLVINLTTIIKGHDADDACFNDRTWNQRLSDIHDLDVEWIAIFIPGPGNAAVGEGIGQRGITNPIELQVTGLGDQLVLVDRVRVELNDRVKKKSSQKINSVSLAPRFRILDISSWFLGGFLA